MCPTLAARAVVGVPGIEVISLYSTDNWSSAATAGFPLRSYTQCCFPRANSRAQVPHEPVFVLGDHKRHVVQEETYCYSFLRGQHCPGLMAWPSPTLPGPVQVPRAIHPEMRMQASSVIETGEQVLPDAVDAQDGEPREIMLSQPGMTQLTSGQALPAQRSRHPLGRQVHGVAFGHSCLQMKDGNRAAVAMYSRTQALRAARPGAAGSGGNVGAVRSGWWRRSSWAR